MNNPTVVEGGNLVEALLPYVDGRPLRRDEADRFAEHFFVSARTVYRRLDVLRSNPDSAGLRAEAAAGPETDLEPSDLQWPLLREGHPATVLSRLVELGPESFWFDWELTGLAYQFNGNLTRLYGELCGLGLPLPSFTTFWRRWQELSPLVRDGAKHGLKNRASLSIHLRHAADHANQVWQLDTFSLDIDVLVTTGRTKSRVRPVLLLLIDDHSRFCVGWALIYRQTRSEDVKALLGAAFEHRIDVPSGVAIGGVPECLIVDNEASIVAEDVRRALEQVPMAVRPAPAHTPIAKGKVERAGQTIQSMIVNGQPGMKNRSAARNGTHLLHLPDVELWQGDRFVEHVADAVERYNGGTSRVLGNRTRRDAYITSLEAQRSSGNERTRVVDDSILARMMLPVARNGMRQMSSQCIVVNGHNFYSDQLADWVGSRKKFIVLQWHHRLERVAVLDTEHRFICMAVRHDLVDDEMRGRIIRRRFLDEAEVVRHTNYAATSMASTTHERELADQSDGPPAEVCPSPVPASAKQPKRSGPADARAAGRTANAPTPSGSSLAANRSRRLADDDAVDEVALRQMSDRFGGESSDR